ncbi:hypothetical protein [Frankia sp. Cj3]|uniref:hypothetical protein n=1 Tax=Frankia sp. Cj3 TaxID=2880976 RepID=UPI001EF54D72|nr:hypothetical protein [Frankia sp. Cj3]
MMEVIALDARERFIAAQVALLRERPTIGVEVTIPELAHACAWNIDGQHGDAVGDGSGRAAVEIAWEALNDPGALASRLNADQRFAIVRPDADAFAAVAILWFYGYMLEPVGEEEGIAHRVDMIARADSGPDGSDDLSFQALKAMAADRDLPLESRVVRHFQWLSTGTFTGEYAYRDSLAEKVRELNRLDRQVISLGKIAFISAASPFGVESAYGVADVVVASNPRYQWPTGQVTEKVTICAQSAKLVDFPGLLDELNQHEQESGGVPRWGGNVTSGIIGSPQGGESVLSMREIISLVEKFTR